MSLTEIETMARTTGASAALVVGPEGVDVWLVDDTTHRASLVERVEDAELGALRAAEITRASFAAPATGLRRHPRRRPRQQLERP